MMAWAKSSRSGARQGSPAQRLLGRGRGPLSPYARAWFQAACLIAAAALAGTFLGAEVHMRQPASAQPAPADAASCVEDLVQPVLVSYSYFEKDEVCCS
jgi:hypothetical protein